MKINHLLLQGQDKITGDVFVRLSTVASADISAFSLCFTRPVLTNQIPNFVRSNYKLSLH